MKAPFREQGFSLVELLVAMAVSSLIITTALTLLTKSRTADTRTRAAEAALAATDRLTDWFRVTTANAYLPGAGGTSIFRSDRLGFRSWATPGEPLPEPTPIAFRGMSQGARISLEGTAPQTIDFDAPAIRIRFAYFGRASYGAKAAWFDEWPGAAPPAGVSMLIEAAALPRPITVISSFTDTTRYRCRLLPTEPKC